LHSAVNRRSDVLRFGMPPYEIILPALGVICSSCVVFTAMNLISRHVSERRVSSRAAPPDEVLRQLERIESIVETTALEVERLAESNRFVAKLLSERAGTP
jgi:hypothetical protein